MTSKFFECREEECVFGKSYMRGYKDFETFEPKVKMDLLKLHCKETGHMNKDIRQTVPEVLDRPNMMMNKARIKDKEVPMYAAKHKFKAWYRELLRWIETLEDKDSAKITRAVIAMMKITPNKVVKEFYETFIMNNETANENYETIVDMLRERFEISSQIEDKETVKELQSFKWGSEPTSMVMDKARNLRIKLLRAQRTKTEDEAEVEDKTKNDKIIILILMINGVQEGRINAIEEMVLEGKLEESKYD